MKNYLCLAFSLLFACCLQATAGTSGVLTYQVVSGSTIQITDCQTSASGTVTIPATLEGKPVTSISGGAFWGCSSMTGIVISTNVTSIGNNQFHGCTQLERAVFKGDAPSAFSGIFDDAASGFKIYYGDEATGFTSSPWTAYTTETYDSTFSFSIQAGSPETVTITDYPTSATGDVDVPSTFVGLSVTCIGNGAFDGCTLLSRITLPDSITTIGDDAFNECGGLTTFTIPANVTDIGDLAFADAGLTSLFFEGDAPLRGDDVFDGYSPVIYYLSGAQGFDEFPWTNTDEYTGLYDFVVYKETIKITDYPDTETGEITIPETIVGKPVSRIGADAFYHCDGLTRISLPENLESIYQNAFEQCSGLTTITIPTNVNYIGFGAYGGCSLDSVFFDGNEPASLGASLFGGAVGFTVYYRDGSTGFSEPTWNSYDSEAYTGTLSFVVSEEEVSITDCQTSVSGDFAIPSQIAGKPVVALEDSVFDQCNSITNISIPNTITRMTTSSLRGADAVTAYSVASGNPVYSSLDGVVFNKNKTQLLRFPDAKAGDYVVPDPVTVIADQAFSLCKDLYSVVIPESVETNGFAAFNNCSQLQQAVFLGNAPYFPSTVFANVATNFMVYYPEGKTGFGATQDGYPTESFDGKFSFDIHSEWVGFFPASLEQSIEITDYPDAETGDLVIPSTLINRSVRTIGGSAFENSLLGEITIPNTVSEIGDSAFSNCALSTLTIPDSVTDIGDFAFCSSTNLKSAIFVGDAPALGYSWYGEYPGYYTKTSVFDETHPDFMIYYFSDQTGYSSPTWEGYPATEIDHDSTSLDFMLWLAEYDLALNANPEDDSNGDGVDLLMEYALNLSPLENNAGNTTVNDVRSGGFYLNYYAAQTGVSYVVEASTNLQTWSESGVSLSAIVADRQSAYTPMDGPKKFLRLTVELIIP